MTEDTTPDAVPADATDEDDPETHPKGTLLLSALFIVLMAATWLYAYTTMMVRS